MNYQKKINKLSANSLIVYSKILNKINNKEIKNKQLKMKL